jgi:DNA-binding MarR family transcriptional regulator
MSKLNRSELPPLIVRAVRRFIANAILFNQQLAEQFGINATDYQLLNLLDLSGHETPKSLATLTRLTTGGVTVALDRLERQGYIVREPNPADRRSVIVRIVPEKLHPIQMRYREINAGLDQIFAAFSDSQLQAIYEFFTRANCLRSHPDSGEPAKDTPALKPKRNLDEKHS